MGPRNGIVGILLASRKFPSSSSTWLTAWQCRTSCDKHQIQPTRFYQWQKQRFENGEAAFERKGKTSGKSAQDRKIEQLQVKLINKNEVIAELMEENVKAKKECGEL